ncbi:hypothetical protein CGMCC3_g6608 [Colletotrichum fructicola]|nr:uncharacterized protein CGMCC3_g6608 [Colletotrichum fructicola]KAE9577356.1 hypothetical protein CGMCC3_g6608 [Colletotrichum fructicola]
MLGVCVILQAPGGRRTPRWKLGKVQRLRQLKRDETLYKRERPRVPASCD